MFATCTTTGTPFVSGSGAFSPSRTRASKRARSRPLGMTDTRSADSPSSSTSIRRTASALATTWSASCVRAWSTARRALPCQWARSNRPTITFVPASFAAGTTSIVE